MDTKQFGIKTNTLTVAILLLYLLFTKLKIDRHVDLIIRPFMNFVNIFNAKLTPKYAIVNLLEEKSLKTADKKNNKKKMIPFKTFYYSKKI